MLFYSPLPGTKKSKYATEEVNRIWVMCKLLITVTDIRISVKFIWEDYITSCCLLTTLAKQSLPTYMEALGCICRCKYPVMLQHLNVVVLSAVLALLAISEISFAYEKTCLLTSYSKLC